MTVAASAAIPVGAKVSVTLPDRYLLLGAMLVYGLPLAALLTGAAVSAMWFEADIAVAAGAVLALLAAVAAAGTLRRRLERSTLRHLRVVRVA